MEVVTDELLSQTDSLDIQDLVRLARDKSQKSRARLVTAINDLYAGEDRLPTETDRTIMFDFLRCLIHKVDADGRVRLAASWNAQDDVPKDLLPTLANDSINVAYPILVKGELLRDEELSGALGNFDGFDEETAWGALAHRRQDVANQDAMGMIESVEAEARSAANG